MKKLSDKSKRTLAVAGIGAVCVVLIIGISYRFSAGKAKNLGVSSSSSSSSSEVVVDAVGASSDSGSSVPSSAQAAASSSKVDQKIQSDVGKPSAPSSKPKAQGSTTNPSQKPSYSSKDTTVSQSSEPSGSETQNGKVYLPGFGWVTNTGGSGSTASDMYENGTKVGKMD